MVRRMVKHGVLPAVIAASLMGCSKGEQQKPAVEPAGTGAAVGQAPDGAALFKQFCASCHPDGGNVSDPGRTLHGSALRKNSITTPDDIVRIMRTPISRMIRFDQSTLPDREARAIAEYVLKTFR